MAKPAILLSQARVTAPGGRAMPGCCSDRSHLRLVMNPRHANRFMTLVVPITDLARKAPSVTSSRMPQLSGTMLLSLLQPASSVGTEAGVGPARPRSPPRTDYRGSRPATEGIELYLGERSIQWP